MRAVQWALNWLHRPATVAFGLVIALVSMLGGVILGSYLAPMIWGP